MRFWGGPRACIWSFLLVSSLFLLALGAGCGTSGSGPDVVAGPGTAAPASGDTVTARIGPGGGTLFLPGGGQLEVPPGALTQETTISVTVVQPDPTRPDREIAYSPDDLVFERPVTLTLPTGPIPPGQFPEIIHFSPANPEIQTGTQITQSSIPLQTVDPVAQTITATLENFGVRVRGQSNAVVKKFLEKTFSRYTFGSSPSGYLVLDIPEPFLGGVTSSSRCQRSSA